jgi:putative cardiolipin synthase
VRLLVDDFPVRSSDEELALLARRENFHLRIFNPTRLRRGLIGPAMEMVIYFKELNRRMHNKLMIVDGHWAVVGGRNIGNAYFGLDDKYNFRDLDILVTGPVIRELEKAFDDYWNSDPAFPGECMTGRISARRRRKIERFQEKQLEKDRRFLDRTCYPSGAAEWTDYFRFLPERMVPGVAEYLQDQPVVRGDRGERLETILGGVGNAAEQKAWVVTPYLIPPESLFETVSAATSNGVDVLFLTASMGANNHTIAHSHYKKYRKKLLDAGAELYEFSHEPNAELMEITDIEPVRSKFVALHIKAIVEDGQRVFLGSLNLDPRAMKINTENIMVIDSPPLAAQMKELVERMLAPGNAWRIYTNECGELRWQSGDDVRKRQPSRTAWQRVSDFFFRLLPVENQL